MDKRIFKLRMAGNKRIKTDIRYICLIIILIGFSGAAMAAGTTYNESFPGERNAGNWYTFKILNVSGLKDSIYHYTVYDYKILDGPYWYRSESWGRNFAEYPAAGMKWLIVWPCGWVENSTTWGYGADRFFAWINGRTIEPEPVDLIDTPGSCMGGRCGSHRRPRLISETINHTTPRDFTYSGDPWGYKDGFELDRMEPGKSNAWAGYLIFQIPESAGPDDIQIAGWFGYYGTAWWNLADREFTQDNIERQRVAELERIQAERIAGIREDEREIITVRMRA